MESVGQKLCQARLRLGLTLEAVSSSTRISLRSLSAIEADQLDQISSPFLYKSFVRQFGEAVGLDAAALEQALLSAAGTMKEPLVPGQGGAPLPPVAAPPKHKRWRFSRSILSGASLCVTLALCSGLYAAWEKTRAEHPTHIVQDLLTQARTGVQTFVDATKHKPDPSGGKRSSATMPAKPDVVTPEVISANGPVARAAPADAPPPNGITSAGDVFHIQLSAIEQSWLSVMTDGKEVYSGILRTAETKTLEGHELARIRTGNAGGVEVVFNGRNLGPLGSHGQVRTVLFNRNGYEVLQPQAVVRLSPFSLVDYPR